MWFATSHRWTSPVVLRPDVSSVGPECRTAAEGRVGGRRGTQYPTVGGGSLAAGTGNHTPAPRVPTYVSGRLQHWKTSVS